MIIKSFIKKLKKDKFFIKKVISTSITRGLASVGTFLFNFVLARYLGVSDYGYFMLAYSILLGCSYLVKFGMPTAILRFASIMYANESVGKIKKLKRDIYYIGFIASFAVGLLLILGQEILIDTFFDGIDIGNTIIALAFSLPFYSFLSIQSAFLKAFKRPEIAPLFEIGLTVFITSIAVLIIVFIGVETSIFNVMICFLISSILVFTVSAITIQKIIKNIPNVDREIKKYEGFYKTLPTYALLRISDYAINFSPTIILGYYVAGEEIALYSIANKTSFVISFILWIVSTVYAPYYSSYYNDLKINELKKILINSTLYMLLLALPLYLVMMIFSNFILAIFGESYIKASGALRIMATAQLINVATGPQYIFLNMIGYENKLKNIVIFTGIVSILFSILLTQTYGYIGATIATSVGLVLQNLLAFYYSKKVLTIEN